MASQDITLIISVIMGVTSIVLAVFAIWLGKSTERDSRANFERTQSVLAEIDKRAAVIENTVAQSQQQLLSTVTGLLQQTFAPTKPDMSEQVGQALIEQLLKDPAKITETIAALQPFIEMSEMQHVQSTGVPNP